MASVVFVVNQKGEEVVSRHFRYGLALPGAICGALVVWPPDPIIKYLFILFFCYFNGLCGRADVPKSSLDAFRNKVRK